MKAMIFAAGLGTRLRPLTNDRPKALIEVGGKPMLEHVIKRLAVAGFDEITINIHHFGQMIIDFLDKNDNFGLNLHISDERDKLLDTGGGILKAREFLDGNEPFLVHNADILTTLDLNAMVEYHKCHNSVATLLVKKRDTQRYFLFDSGYRLNGWINKKTGEINPSTLTIEEKHLIERAFGGIHVISPSLFPLLEEYAQGNDAFSITPFYINECDKCHIQGYESAKNYEWIDVGKIEALEAANELLSRV